VKGAWFCEGVVRCQGVVLLRRVRVAAKCSCYCEGFVLLSRGRPVVKELCCCDGVVLL